MRQLMICLGCLLILTGCTLLPSQGPELNLKPQVEHWQFNQPLSKQAWRDITEELSPALVRMRIYNVYIHSSSAFKPRSDALKRWLLRQGVPEQHIHMAKRIQPGFGVDLVRYQSESQVCQKPRVLYLVGDVAHSDSCTMTQLRWRSMVHPERMLKTGD